MSLLAGGVRASWPHRSTPTRRMMKLKDIVVGILEWTAAIAILTVAAYFVFLGITHGGTQ